MKDTLVKAILVASQAATLLVATLGLSWADARESSAPPSLAPNAHVDGRTQTAARDSKGLQPMTTFVSLSALGSDVSVTGVPPGNSIGLVLSDSVEVSTLHSAEVTLLGKEGVVPTTVVVSAASKTLTITPQRELAPGAQFSVFVDGLQDRDGSALPLTSLALTTASLRGIQEATPTTDELDAPADCDNKKPLRGYVFCRTSGSVAGGVFSPGTGNTDGRWRLNGPTPKVLTPGDFAPGELPSGTSIFGVVRRVDDRALPNVAVSLGAITTRTDANGRFLLKEVPSGHQILLVDGHSANRASEEYGEFLVGVDIKPNQANGVPYTMFMPRIAARDKIRIDSPTLADTVITHPSIPGLEIHIPKGSVVRDRTGKVLTEFAIVPMPVDRSPVPVPANFEVYFSAQPGGATIENGTADPTAGLSVIYPNYMEGNDAPQGFYYYDAQGAGWVNYSQGHPSADGGRVEANIAWAARTFMPEGGPGVGGKAEPPQKIKCNNGGTSSGDPVDCATGSFVHTSVDLELKDLAGGQFIRTYNSSDAVVRAFGRGSSSIFDMYITVHNATSTACANLDETTTVDLVTGDGGIYPFSTSGGIPFTATLGVHTASPSRFFGATLAAPNEVGLLTVPVTLTDGTIYNFSTGCPGALSYVTDRFGNTTNLGYTAGLLTQIVLPSGRQFHLAYNGNNLVNLLTDSSGRSVSYAYNASNQLTTVTFPDSTTEKYTYDGNGNMLTVIDRAGNTMVTNLYDANQRVYKQTYADNSTYLFAYTLVGSAVTATDVTDGRGYVTHIAFDAAGYPVSETKASGTALAQLTTYTRGFNEFVTSVVDPLGRTTAMTYDSFGNILTKTFLVGTSNAATYTFTYTPDFHQIATATDPLSHTTTYTYTGPCLTSVKDALNHSLTITCNAAGQGTQLKDPLGHIFKIGYLGSDLHTVMDPLNNTTTFTVDAVGRTVATQDPLGHVWRLTYDTANRIVGSVDPLNQSTTYAYDGNGNLLSVIDPSTGKTQFAYDARNRQLSRTDALNQLESWTYDGMGNALTYTDRKMQTTTAQYDALNRLSLITYADSSTVVPTFDAGNRLTQVVDSVSGTIVRNYDGQNRLTLEQTPQGSVNYTYDAAERRKTMTPSGQAQIVYTFDNANRLTKIVQSSQTVSIGYDNDNRRTSLTLPNGIVVSYAYDNANQTTGITFKTGAGATLASTAYTYNAAGERLTQVGGFAPDVLPSATVGVNTFDSNNRQTASNGLPITYAQTGDPLSNAAASQTYTFDARHHLSQVQQGGTTIATYSYDTFGRRTGKTVGGNTTSFLYDGINPIKETTGSVVNAILSGLDTDERFVRTEPSGSRYFLVDALGSTLALADAAGAIQQTYAYEPFGQSTSSGSSTNPYQYTGRENDVIGLYYYRARYYSPTLKRFISEDPSGLIAGLNEYAYSANNPVLYRDPTGRFFQYLGGAAVGAFVGGAVNAFNYYSVGCDWWQGFKNGAVGGAITGAGAVAGQPILAGAVGGGVTQYLNRKDGVMTSPNPYLDIGLAAGFGGFGSWVGGKVGSIIASELGWGQLGSEEFGNFMGNVGGFSAGVGVNNAFNTATTMNGENPPCECQK